MSRWKMRRRRPGGWSRKDQYDNNLQPALVASTRRGELGRKRPVRTRRGGQGRKRPEPPLRQVQYTHRGRRQAQVHRGRAVVHRLGRKRPGLGPALKRGVGPKCPRATQVVVRRTGRKSPCLSPTVRPRGGRGRKCPALHQGPVTHRVRMLRNRPGRKCPSRMHRVERKCPRRERKQGRKCPYH